MKTALFIGRFQPFHIGHLWAVQHIMQEFDFVKIGIGSVQKFRTEVNPYTFAERERMIHSALRAEGIKNYRVYGIKDIPEDNKWAEHVENITGKFDAVFTGDDLVKKLMEDAGKDVQELPRWQDISATEVRRRIEAGENWQELVPIAVRGFLEE